MARAGPFAFSEYIQNKPTRTYPDELKPALKSKQLSGPLRPDPSPIDPASEVTGSSCADSSGMRPPETPTETPPETVSGRKPFYCKVLTVVSAPRQNLGSPPSCRLPRFIRARHSWRPPLVLQERDLAFIQTTAEYRLLSTPQCLLLFPESRDAVYRRLQLLFHHGYLDRLRGDPSAPMVYALGPRGAEVLVERGLLQDIGEWRKKNQDLQDRYIAHQAMIVNFRIALTLATREPSDVRLLFFHREGLALRDRVTVTHNGSRQVIPINPDGFFGLQFPDLPEGRNRAFFFLEADRSTMIRERFVQKLLSYWEWFRQGGHTKKLGIKSFRVVTVTKSEERVKTLLTATARTPVLRDAFRMFWFTSEKRYLSQRLASVLEPIWETPDQPSRRQSLLPRPSLQLNIPQG